MSHGGMEAAASAGSSCVSGRRLLVFRLYRCRRFLSEPPLGTNETQIFQTAWSKNVQESIKIQWNLSESGVIRHNDVISRDCFDSIFRHIRLILLAFIGLSEITLGSVMCHGLNKDTNYDLSETRAAAVPASRHWPGEYPTIFGSHSATL